MTVDMTKVAVEVYGQISDIPAADWDACANPDPAHFDPFVSHAFLLALEQAGTISADTGWIAQHLVLRANQDAYNNASNAIGTDVDEGDSDDDSGSDSEGNLEGDEIHDAVGKKTRPLRRKGEILGCMPLYLKLHSAGEYIFDHAWADAYSRAGGQYYPKLQAAVPFTPVPGRRLLVKPGPNETLARNVLARGAIELTRRQQASSLHMTFLSEQEWTLLGGDEAPDDLAFLQRTGSQFHWLNDNYGSFDDFLATLASRKRKVLRKERRAALQSGITISHFTGGDITPEHWDAFFQFYIDTSTRKWGQPYLNREFFTMLGAAMADRCLLILAQREGRIIAGALNIIGGSCLYGRYWGAIEHHPFLHFEICYYQAIDFAIAHGLARVEAGAQGEHKLVRGYVPVPTYSLHWIDDPNFRGAVENYLNHERRHAEMERLALAEFTPFKKSC